MHGLVVAESFFLSLTGFYDTVANLFAGLAGRNFRDVLERHGRDFNLDVDAVE